TACTVLFPTERGSGQGPKEVPSARRVRRNHAIGATTSREAARAYAALLEGRSEEELTALSCDSDTGIAIAAAWELYRRRASVAGETTGPLQRWLGFIGGRTRLCLPLRWEVQLVRAILCDNEKQLRQVLRSYAPRCSFLEKDEEGFAYV